MGNGYVQAPDGSRAGLVWGPNERHMREYLPPEEGRWGVFAIRFPHPLRTTSDFVDNFRAILPDLNKKYAEIQARSPERAVSRPEKTE